MSTSLNRLGYAYILAWRRWGLKRNLTKVAGADEQVGLRFGVCVQKTGDFGGIVLAVGIRRRCRSSTILNPGSIGLPWQKPSPGESINPAWAEYALVGWQHERLSVEFRRVPYDLAELEQAVIASGMPHAAWWLADWRAVTLARAGSPDPA